MLAVLPSRGRADRPARGTSASFRYRSTGADRRHGGDRLPLPRQQEPTSTEAPAADEARGNDPRPRPKPWTSTPAKPTTVDCLPCGSLPFGVFPERGSHSPRGYQPRVRALSAFLTLSGLFSASPLPALFRAGPALGVSPFGADLHPQSRAPSRTPLPSCGSGPARPPLRPSQPHGRLDDPWDNEGFRGSGATPEPCHFRALLSADVRVHRWTV